MFTRHAGGRLDPKNRTDHKDDRNCAGPAFMKPGKEETIMNVLAMSAQPIKRARVSTDPWPGFLML